MNEIRYLPEEVTARLITRDLAYSAVRSALIAASGNTAKLFPTVHGHVSNSQNQFTVKSGTTAELSGIKIGTYFPTNDARGLPRHGTSILLFDQERGRIGAVIEAAYVNAFRTAAADAVATHVLARTNARVLAVFGTGHQALHEVLAVAQVRDLERVLVVGRDAVRASRFIEKIRHEGLPTDLEVASIEVACATADIIVTATTATSPLFTASAVRPGTHISTMGSDALGKQELPPELFARASLFCDLPSQSRAIGEFQHLPDHTAAIQAIGDVLTGIHPGRSNDDEVTIFDSSGIALQDLAIAQALLAADV